MSIRTTFQVFLECVLFPLFAAGCAGASLDTTDSPPEWHSGKRLRARVLDGGNGAAEFVEWRDGATGQACTFSTAEDGQIRCLPRSFSILYEDPSCEHPVLLEPPPPPCGKDAPSWVVYGDAPLPTWVTYDMAPDSGSACTSEPRLRGARVTGQSGATTFFSRSASGCTPEAVPTATVLSLETVSPDTFVAAHERVGDAAGGLAPIVRAADDGSSEVVAVVDVSSGLRCGKVTSRSGVQRCVPDEHVAWRSGRYFADSACTDGIAYTDCDTPDIVYSDDPSDCSDARVFAVGEQFEGTPYLSSGGTCTVVPWQHSYYRFVETRFDAFPEVENINAGGGRVVARRWGAERIALSPDSSLADASTGNDCLERYGSDVRCAPAYADVAQLSGVFADPACSSPVLDLGGAAPSEPHGVGGSACGRPPAAVKSPTYAITGADACGAPEYHAIGQEYLGTTYSLSGSSLCQPTARVDGHRYVLPGAQIDPATFPLLVDRVE